MVKLGDCVKCPECNGEGRIVWVSKDGESVGIRCPANHCQKSRPDSRLGSLSRSRSKNVRNMVFITKIK